MTYSHSVGGTTWRFDDLREVMAKASPARSGDLLAGVAAGSDAERVAAQMWPMCRSGVFSKKH